MEYKYNQRICTVQARLKEATRDMAHVRLTSLKNAKAERRLNYYQF